MRHYPRTAQIEGYRAVRVGTTLVSNTTVTRLDPAPDAERRRIRIANPSTVTLYLQLANVGEAAPAVSGTAYHYRLAESEAVEIPIGPEVAVWGLMDGMAPVTIHWVEF